MTFSFTKKFLNIFLFVLLTFSALSAQSAIFVGGPTYYDSHFSIDELKNSGFTTAIVWTIHINETGDLNYNGEFLICKDGKYVGDQKYPQFPKNMALLKTAPTSINRLEVGLSAWGSSTFANIKHLVETEGTDTNSVLYKNFKALKETIPVFDAINFDDESTYDEPSSTKFAVMLADIGFKVALCPYTASNYWKGVAANTNAQRPGTVDLIYLQCYAGGSGNNPCTWDDYFDGIPVYPGLWGNLTNSATIQSKMKGYKNNCGSEGGFIWIYDDIKNTDAVEAQALAVNSSFNITYNLNATVSNPSPVPNSFEIGFSESISWTSGENTVSHDVYFGTSVNPEFVSNQTETGYTPSTLEENKRYFWRVNEITATDTIVGPVYTFHTLYPLPAEPKNPSPENEAMDIPGTQSLSWIGDSYVKNYKLYLGTDSNLDENNFIKNIYIPIYVPTKALEPNTTYYWRVDAENATGKTIGTVWSFSTSDTISSATGKALEFDGNNDKVVIENSPSLQVTGTNITLEAWVNPNSFKSEIWQGSIVTKDWSGGAGYDNGYALRCGKQGQFDISLGSGSWNELTSPQNSIPIGAWTHIAGTYDGKNIKLYVNGEEVASHKSTFSIANNSNKVHIGESAGWAGRVFNGKIDEVRIWNISRTAGEIKNSMNSSLGESILGSENSGLVGYWSFDEGEGQIVNDKSYFANNGVLGSTTGEQTSDPLWSNSEVTVGVSEFESEEQVILEYLLKQNYPNPFNPKTTIEYNIPNASLTKLTVFDVLGNEIKTLVNREQSAGNYKISFNASNLASGTYFYKLQVGDFVQTKKLLLLK
ncbi:MAG: T9SS type A sorting domain-containing protein [Melioribacteraceae bacterium]|nr:T9SS type A sorting domain-containing protein [Melioribacteraceae bacterium]